MKKVLIALGCVAFFGLASCKKDYTCNCEINGETSPAPVENVKKSDAENFCDSREATAKAQDPDATCSLD